MQYLTPIDAAFLQMESARTPMHVGGLLTFRLPADAPADFLRTLFANQRAQVPSAAPFNQRLVPKRMRQLKQIGRASCRERVCQYVYISVVAVSFKKKRTRNVKKNN